MKPATLTTITRHHIHCPHCNEIGSYVDHLLNRNTTFGPWYCDKCGKALEGKVVDGLVFVEKSNKSSNDCIVILRMMDHEGNYVYMAVRGISLDQIGPNEFIYNQHHRYFYEEHTCPTNWLNESLEVFYQYSDCYEADPHGIAEYIGTLGLPSSGKLDSEKLEELAEDFFSKQKGDLNPTEEEQC